MKRRRGITDAAPAEESQAGGKSLEAIFAAYVRPAILTLATALLVSTPLIPSESIISDGSGASWHLMWLALAFASLVGSALITASSHRWTWADLCVGLLVGWHLLSAYLCDGNQRHAWNAAWQWGAYGALAIVLRQQLTTAKETRAIVAVMIALSLAVSLHAFYQYGYSQPLVRAQYKKNPEAILQQMQQMGIDTAPGSPGRSLAENRINSREPMAEFALTNSLAGFLLPWMLIGLAVAFWSVQQSPNWKTVAACLVIAVILAGVLVLTKSRTAWLAAAGGCALILLYGRRSGWQLDWRWPAGIAAAVMVIGLIAVAAKGLDAEVLSESPKSVLYRLEYWRATAALIADEPLFGVGPGNFQERYANHKLPQASETVADPHNFLLEVWSTAGTPALLALLALMFATAWQLSRRGASDPTSKLTEDGPATGEMQISHFAIYAGAVVGLLLAGILGFIAFLPLETTRDATLDASRDSSLGVPIVWLTGFVSFLFCFVALKDWVERGELPRSAVIIALIALLVNLLAAGAAIFPGVVNAAWLLWAIALRRDVAVATSSATTSPEVRWLPAIHLAAAALAVAAMFGCYYTEYQPVFNGRMLLMEAGAARQSGHYSQAESLLDQAIAADPWSPDPWRSLAELRLGAWLARPLQKHWGPFTDALEKFKQKTPHHYTQHQQRGDWLLLASRRIKSGEHLQSAAEAYEAAIRCYPNSAFLHAQLASAYAEQERTADARREADEAARLDALCPHQEQKLEKRLLHDPHWPPRAKLPAGITETPKSAAEVVAKLRGLERSQQDPVLLDPALLGPIRRSSQP